VLHEIEHQAWSVLVFFFFFFYFYFNDIGRRPVSDFKRMRLPI
jgi:hypothetical protein